MKTTTLRRASGVAAITLTLAAGLVACGDDDSSTGGGDETTSETGDEFGDGCAGIPKGDAAGSFDSMVKDPVATAASTNPLLKTLVSAVGVAGLGDTLNNAKALTVFAPADTAFAKIPAKDLQAALADKKGLTTILTHHVLGERLGPDDIAGDHETLAKDMVTVEGDAEGMTVKGALTGGDATVVCGNIQTKNATVYVIDSVLAPGGGA